MKNLISKISVSIGLFLLLSTAAYANNGLENGDVSVIRCTAKDGEVNFSLFLQSMVNNDSFYDSIIEPFNDILSRNSCHANDILTLVRQLDRIRSQIREKSFQCETEDIPQLKKAYVQNAAEIYYVRNVFDGGLALRLPFNLLKNKEVNEKLVADRDKLFTDMKQKYFKKDVFTEAEFLGFFLNLESKYSSRIQDYAYCEGGQWATVSQKWREFQNFITNDFGGLRSAYNGIARESERFSTEVKRTNTVQMFTDEGSFTNFVQSFGSIKLDEEPTAPVLQRLKTDRVVDRQDFLNIQFQAVEERSTKKLETEMLTNFYSQYAVSGDGTEAIVASLNNLSQIIEESYSDIDTLVDGSDKINSRQCTVTQ
jgi:hypothetical protein